MTSLNVRWYKGLTTNQQKTEFKKQIALSMPVLKRLLEMIQEELNDEGKSLVKNSNYDKPRWEYFVADNLGAQRALNKIMELIPKEI